MEIENTVKEVQEFGALGSIVGIWALVVDLEVYWWNLVDIGGGIQMYSKYSAYNHIPI